MKGESHPQAGAVPEQELRSLTIRLFGPFEVLVNGDPLARLRTRKGQWLLALLTLRAGCDLDRAWLAGTLWPDSPEPRAFNNLRVALADLRRALGPEANRLRSPAARSLRLDLTGMEADVVAFDRAINSGAMPSLERAVTLYRGPLLEGCAEEWVFAERQSREQAYLRALETLAEQALASGNLMAAEGYLRRAIAVDPLRESAQRALMQALAAGSNYASALLAYRELRLRLHRELNAAPDPETQAVFQQVRAEARSRAQVAPAVGYRSPTAPLPPDLPRLPLSDDSLTFLFTDLAGSSRHWEEHPDARPEAVARHEALLRQAVEARGGTFFKTLGEQCCAAFPTAADALAAALAAQRAHHAEWWGEVGELRVRMALHTITAQERAGDYFGPTFNRLARLLGTGHGGQILLSQATAELVRDQLPEGANLRDLGERRLPDLSRPEPIFQLVVPDLPASFSPLRSLEAFRHNLPLQLTRFIGRERQMAEVKQLLGTSRLVTLTGAGGCGKTRLALQVAARMLEHFPEGVWLVELAPLADPALAPQTVATALGVQEAPSQPLLQTLVEQLRPRQLLLVLDNCEHVVGACAQLAEGLLQRCPRLRVLATSREALGIAGETRYRVPSLSVPEGQRPAALEELGQYEAVRLFLERAGAVQPGFRLTPANAPGVAEVCRRLDGIPLAIELAAARVNALPVEKIAARLDDRFRLLTSGSRTALPRQQTLRATMDWSYDLLTEAERVLLGRLSVFAGGWTLAAAEAVCAGGGIEEWEVLDLLTRLVDQSLATYEEPQEAGWGPRTVPAGTGGAPWGPAPGRYRLLETMRQYARDRLLEAGEAAVVRGRHYEWCLALAEEAEPELYGAEQTAWLDRLEREHDNLRAALGWSGAHGEGKAGLRLGGALRWFWSVRGYWTEGREYLAGLLALPGAEARTAVRAKALHAAGWLAWHPGDFGAARVFDEQGLAIFQELGDKRGSADSLNHLGWVAYEQGDFGTARALLEECLAINRELVCKQGIVKDLEGLAAVAVAQAHSERAARLFGAAEGLRELSGAPLAAADRAEHDRSVAAVRTALGEAAFTAAWAAGRALSLEQAVAQALNADGAA
jgi:predicted ATPase/DNA-binding SARP family transcriptional activator